MRGSLQKELKEFVLQETPVQPCIYGCVYVCVHVYVHVCVHVYYVCVLLEQIREG